MHTVILMMILAVVSSSAMAEWFRLGTSPQSSNFTYYVEPTTIRRSGNETKMWVMFDYPSVMYDHAGKRYLSSTHLMVFDCKEELQKMLGIWLYTGNMGKGDYVSRYNAPANTPWELIPPNSVIKHIRFIACDLKNMKEFNEFKEFVEKERKLK